MFRKIKGWLNKSATDEHYKRQADDASPFFEDELPPFAEEVFEEPRIEVHDFDGMSSDIKWMTFNHDTGEVIIQFLNHGDEDEYAYAYAYKGVPYEEFVALIDGSGPFPVERVPFYQKKKSTGQRANFYLRNDHEDDLYEYERIESPKTSR